MRLVVMALCAGCSLSVLRSPRSTATDGDGDPIEPITSCSGHIPPIAIDALGAVVFGVTAGVAGYDAFGPAPAPDDERPVLAAPIAIVSAATALVFVASAIHGVVTRRRCVEVLEAATK